MMADALPFCLKLSFTSIAGGACSFFPIDEKMNQKNLGQTMLLTRKANAGPLFGRAHP